MPINPYAPCPCGSGKKLKFCCSDLIAEMEKISRMLEGDQPKACLAHIRSLRAKHPNRESLLGLQAMLELHQQDFDAAEQTVNHFLQQHPTSPLALAESAILRAQTERCAEAVEALQSSLEGVESHLPMRIVEAIGAVGRALLAEGKILAARSYLIQQAAVSDEQDDRAYDILRRINSAEEVPLIWKEDPRLSDAPEDVAWKDEFDKAKSEYFGAKFRRAAQQFHDLLEPSGGAACVWRNLALSRTALADHEGAVEALRKLAELDVPLDDAVEAEALAQTLDKRSDSERVDVVKVVFACQDLAALEAALAVDRRATETPGDPSDYAQQDAPPPRQVYWLLDKPLSESGVDLALADTSSVVAQLFVFGRETDREPRLELIAHRDGDLQQARQILAEIASDAVGEPSEEEVVSSISKLSATMNWNWRLPVDTPRQHSNQLVSEKRREILYETWTNEPMPEFDGQSPAQAAQQPEMRNRVLAAILLLESAATDPQGFDYNELRRKLNLPECGPIDPASVDTFGLTLLRLHRVDATKLPDDELVVYWHRSIIARARRAAVHIGPEICARESFDGKIDKANVFGLLAELTDDIDQTFAYLDQARQADEAAGQSSAQWDLTEMAASVDASDSERFVRLLNHIRDEHFDEPGVSQQLMQILVAAGIVDPDGTPLGPPPGEEPSQIVVPSGEGSAGGEIWTPESAAGGESKGKIWTPD